MRGDLCARDAHAFSRRHSMLAEQAGHYLLMRLMTPAMRDAGARCAASFSRDARSALDFAAHTRNSSHGRIRHAPAKLPLQLHDSGIAAASSCASFGRPRFVLLRRASRFSDARRYCRALAVKATLSGVARAHFSCCCQAIIARRAPYRAPLLRHALPPIDGALHFRPFRASNYRAGLPARPLRFSGFTRTGIDSSPRHFYRRTLHELIHAEKCKMTMLSAHLFCQQDGRRQKYYTIRQRTPTSAKDDLF